MPSIPDVGVEFNASAFVQTLKRAKVDHINAFARCNLGFAYYPTKIGIVHPGLRFDLLGQIVECAHAAGIGVTAYFNAGLDHEHAMQHRDWCKVDKEGAVYYLREKGNFSRRMCLNTPYGAHLLAMIEEVLAAYPLDGLFLDCFNLKPCYGHECLDGVRQRGMDPLNDRDVEAFGWQITKEFQERVIERVESLGLQIPLYFNGLPFRWQPTHLELEVLPTAEWGYDVLPWQIRYVRTLGKPYLMMTGRFHGGWGDFGGLRTEQSLLFDCYNALANGGGCSVGDHPHPRARLEPAVYDLISRVFGKIAQLDEWTAHSRTVADLLVVYPGLRNYPGQLIDYASIAGAARMLMELKHQFDISDHFDDLPSYPVVILPDTVRLDDAAREKVERYLSGGGCVISSAFSTLDPGDTRFVLRDHPCEFAGPEPGSPVYLLAKPEIAAGLPEMPITVTGPGVAMCNRSGQVLAELVGPYSNRGAWDGFHEDLYNPPDRKLGRPAIARSGGHIHFAFPIFRGYNEEAIPDHKVAFQNSLRLLFDRPVVEVEGMPSFGQVTVTETADHVQVHLLTYLPELRGVKRQIIEEPITVCDVRVRLRWREGEALGGTFLAPSRQPLAMEAGEVRVPRVSGYQLVVFEKAPRSAGGMDQTI